MGNEEELINCKCTFLVKFIDSYDVKEASALEEDCKTISFLSLLRKRQVDVTGLEDIKMAASCTW